MNTPEILEASKNIFRPAVNLFEKTIYLLESKFDKPIFTEDSTTARRMWKHPYIGREQICIIRGVRIVSGFYSCLVLLENGFTQEIAVILRTICDFHHDIIFLLEDYGKTDITPNQKKFVEDCALPVYLDIKIPFKGVTKIAPLNRDKILAAGARILGEIANPTDAKQMMEIDNDVFSRDTPRLYTFAQQMVLLLQRTFNTFSIMYVAFGLNDQAKELLVARKDFEKNTANFGINYDIEGEKALRNIKKGKPI
jgi:hypothetical protein